MFDTSCFSLMIRLLVWLARDLTLNTCSCLVAYYIPIGYLSYLVGWLDTLLGIPVIVWLLVTSGSVILVLVWSSRANV